MTFRIFTVAAAAFTLFVPTGARAQAPLAQIGLRDGGDRVIVSITGVSQGEGATLTSSGDRIELALAQTSTRTTVGADDATIKRIDIKGTPHHARLSIQLRHGRRSTQLTARSTAIIADGSSIMVVIPRDPANALVKPAPAAPAAAAIEKIEAETEPAPQPEIAEPAVAAPVIAEPAPAPLAEETAPAAEPPTAAPAAAITIPAPTPRRAAPAPTSTRPQAPIWLAVVGLLGVAAVCTWVARRRKKSDHPSGTIQIIATQSLGPKAKIVWITAGDRDLIIAVGDKGPRLLSTWKNRSGRDAQETGRVAHGNGRFAHGTDSPRAATHDDSMPQLQPSALPRARTINTSPAVAGLVRLRELVPDPINEAVASDDAEADAEWARELMLATRRTRA